MAFAPSPPEESGRSQLLFSGSADRTARLWDASPPWRQLKAKKLPGEVTAIAALRRATQGFMSSGAPWKTPRCAFSKNAPALQMLLRLVALSSPTR